MESNYVRCWDTQDSPKYLPGYSEFMAQVINAGISPYMKFEWGSIEYVFSLNELERHGSTFTGEAKTTLNSILNGEVPLCARCGCYYTTPGIVAYRDVDGCVSKVCECARCVSLFNEDLYEMQITRFKNGIEAALDYQMEIFRRAKNT